MRLKNYILILLFLIPIVKKGFSTAQIPDTLAYKGEVFKIYTNPLEQLPGVDTIRPFLFGDKEEICYTTACWREYQASWEIIKNELYLTAIYSCCYFQDSIKADLKQLFGSRCKNNKVKADWVTSEIHSPQGKMLYYVHMGYGSLYEKEVIYEIKRGRLVGITTYDNSKSRKSIYSGDSILNLFINSSIRWKKLPRLEKMIKVYVEFSANEQGIIDSVNVKRGFDELFDQEAIRIVKSIPNWDVFYRMGKHERRKNTIAIAFDRDNRVKH